ncbi:M20 metallopeptidase family protein [Hydrogenophilus thermoluteolus]|uniref:M20 metallopeptidase family protein n=1 Tax=Hydrogenophilus thermoluteolus TaxID=297 RepID=UPI003F66ACC6
MEPLTLESPVWQRWHDRWHHRFAEWQTWRRHLHRHPELAFQEEATATFVAERLRAIGLTPQTGWAKTGVVASITGTMGAGPTIALRADMDALPLEEANTFDHRSCHPGRMHACGHDGHTAMLLAAAEAIAAEPDFAGTVVFLFQPAEEGGGGRASWSKKGCSMPLRSTRSTHCTTGRVCRLAPLRFIPAR